MDFFSEDGHLTNAGLRALTEETAAELARLEISEHLAYCTPCADRYVHLLEEGPLLESVAFTKAQRQITRQKLRITLGRCATVGTAACLAVFLYFSSSYIELPTSQELQNLISFQLPDMSYLEHILDDFQAWNPLNRGEPSP